MADSGKLSQTQLESARLLCIQPATAGALEDGLALFKWVYCVFRDILDIYVGFFTSHNTYKRLLASGWTGGRCG